MTRRDKQSANVHLRNKILDAIVALDYWPREWTVRVEFGHTLSGHLAMKKKKATLHKETVLHLRLRTNWLENVLARGRAVVGGQFVQDAYEVPVPAGMEAAFHADTVYAEGRGPVPSFIRQATGFFVRYAGTWTHGHTLDEAVHGAIRPFAAALYGLPENISEMPF